MESNVMNNNRIYSGTFRKEKESSRIKMPVVIKKEEVKMTPKWSKDVVFDGYVPIRHTEQLVELLKQKIIGDYKFGKRKELAQIVMESKNTVIIIMDWKRHVGFDTIIALAKKHGRHVAQPRSLVICANNFSGPAKSMANSGVYSFLVVYDLEDIKKIESIEI